MSNKVTLCKTDGYDGFDYYTYTNRNPIQYTDNPFPELHKADKIEIDTLHFSSSVLACIVNTLVSEGYEPYYKPVDGYVFGSALYFRISKENKVKLRQKIKGNLK